MSLCDCICTLFLLVCEMLNLEQEYFVLYYFLLFSMFFTLFLYPSFSLFVYFDFYCFVNWL